MVVRALESNSWPSVTGEVLESYVASGRGSEGGTVYHAHVLYEYEVSGTTYQSVTVKLGDTSKSSVYSTYQKVVDAHPVGSSVTVFYDPDDPNLACLETGLNFIVVILFGIGVLLIRSFVRMKKRVGQQELDVPMDQNQNQDFNKPIEP